MAMGIGRAAMGRVRPGLVVGVGLLLVAGCGKGSGVAAELSALKDGGHAVGEFTDTDPAPLHAKACKTGTLDKVPALLCEFASADAVSMGQSGVEAWLGQTATGVVLRRDLFLLGLSDRERADPNGKAISKLRRTFQKKK